MSDRKIPESAVLIATSIWLYKNGWRITHLSVAKGQNIDWIQDKRQLKDSLKNVGLNTETISFESNGADIIAIKENQTWKIECKGFSDAAPSTNRNNFDRALASTVTYFDNSQTKLGLAVPIHYKTDVQKRISQALRHAINLSIFFFNPDNNHIEHIDTSINLGTPLGDLLADL